MRRGGLSVAVVSLVGNLVASDFSAAKAVFTKRCMACHTYGHGVKVGPDLKRVTDRRKRDWLLAFVRSSTAVIRSGDPTATKLFRQFKSERMPDWTDFSPELIASIVDYLKADGPEQRPPDERNAATATLSEIDTGRGLFHGRLHFAYASHACAACHSIRDPKVVSGGSLGPDLTSTYFRYQDRAMTEFLRHPCIPQDWALSSMQYLTPQESFAIKAYLSHAAGLTTSSEAGAPSAATKSLERRIP
jgi:mono/diheme cytochrome c family protein